MIPSGSKDVLKPSSADCIDALLPQTQCTQCGFPSCREYAEALVAGQADLNRCPPGGTSTIAALARSLGLAPKALDPACGEQRPWMVARIHEAVCIGCTLCIQACPVDAILGAAKRMHTVIESECTGCALCLDPCPVDCIDLPPMMMMTATAPGSRGRRNASLADSFLEGWMRERAPLARRRFQARRQRQLRQTRTEGRPLNRAAMPGRDADRVTKQAVIRGAVDRARHRRRAARDQRHPSA